SISTKSRAANQARNAATMRLRAMSKGRRSACTSGVHQGDRATIQRARKKRRKPLAQARTISMLPATNGACMSSRPSPRRVLGRTLLEEEAVKVIASSLRKGNIVDLDGKLYVILTAENIHPGKGTPVTQLDMRRLSDGVKSSQRYKTTDQV